MIGLDVPRVRDGSYFPSLLEPRRRAENEELDDARYEPSIAGCPAPLHTACGV